LTSIGAGSIRSPLVELGTNFANNPSKHPSMSEQAFAVEAAPQPTASARQKGPLVYLDMDQQELDDNYDQIKYAPNQPQIVGRYTSTSDATRARLGEPQRLSYGSAAVEGMDFYAARQPNAPIFVFIHGGAWRRGAARDYIFPAEMVLGAGAHFIALDFDNVETTKGDLTPMADQVRRAVAWVHTNAATFGGDPGRLYVCGHSSGGHLAGVVMTTDWARDFGLPVAPIRAGLLCSGMYDLTPVRLSARSSYVRFTDTIVEALSPIRHIDRLTCPVTVAHGDLETPEFQRQARAFVAAATATGKTVELMVGPGYNHFEILETLGNPYGFLGQASHAMMES
jgi:arylformamidase